MSKQEAKADAGKTRLTLVPRKILFEIARVREFGNSESWKKSNKRRSAKWEKSLVRIAVF